MHQRPQVSEAIEAAITELVGANRIEAAMAERQHKAAFPPGFVASKREVLRTLIAAAVAEARGSSGLREAASKLCQRFQPKHYSNGSTTYPSIYHVDDIRSELEALAVALAADAKEQTAVSPLQALRDDLDRWVNQMPKSNVAHTFADGFRKLIDAHMKKLQ